LAAGVERPNKAAEAKAIESDAIAERTQGKTIVNRNWA
jgi:hypothetical protein